MIIQAICACGKKISVNESMAGAVAQCIRCGRMVHVPGAPPPPPSRRGISDTSLSDNLHGAEPREGEESAADALPANAAAPAEDSAREYVYWLLIFAFIPLVFTLTSPE